MESITNQLGMQTLNLPGMEEDVADQDSRTAHCIADAMEGTAPPDRSSGRTIHVLVEVEPREPPLRLEFDTNQVTGRALKERAAIPLDSDLARRHGQRLELVTNDETITIDNGDHFVSMPPGTIS